MEHPHLTPALSPLLRRLRNAEREKRSPRLGEMATHGYSSDMNSCLYECSVMHHRFAPKVHHFQHDLFMFYLDLDEVELVAKKIFLFSYNRKNIYSFRDADHEPAGENPLKERLGAFLRQNGIDLGPFARVMLLTLPRIFGYVFNPISIYYCFDEAGKPLCAVAEVGNTFREMKLFLLRREELEAGLTFKKIIPKQFYVSPFSELDLSFDFKLKIPGGKLDVKIDDLDLARRSEAKADGEEKILITTLTGQRAELTNKNLSWFTLKYPLVTVKVIFLIHWHALRLWLKRAPFYRKSENTALQREVLRPHSTLPSK